MRPSLRDVQEGLVQFDKNENPINESSAKAELRGKHSLGKYPVIYLKQVVSLSAFTVCLSVRFLRAFSSQVAQTSLEFHERAAERRSGLLRMDRNEGDAPPYRGRP